MKPLAGKAICRKCHPRCERCTGYGFHVQVCQKCAGYKRAEQCEDECPSDHYADELHRECNPCHAECRGCSGPGAHNCFQCRNWKIYIGEANANSTTFNCTADCTNDYPHRVYTPEFEPYCSPVATHVEAATNASARTSVFLFILVVSMGVVCIAVIYIAWYCRVQAKTKKEAVNMTRAMAGMEDSSEPLHRSKVEANLSKFQVIREVELRRGKLIGTGAFGEVSKGMWVPDGQNVKIPVAIKVLKNMSGRESSKEFLDEAYIMASVDHPNLLKLLGVCMTNEMMLVSQLMPLGPLHDYVKKHKASISSRTMLNWSTQIARGMAYLEKKALVHRDLAARNVLVQKPSTVKISDFGLAKLLPDSNEYKAAGGIMPIKWLAPECIRQRIFTTKSDVWAFGVTIWEIVTFGRRPYETVAAKDVPELIESGGRLEQPDHCSLQIYMILCECWFLNPASRPTFEELVNKFQEYARDPERYLVTEGDKAQRAQQPGADLKELIQTISLQQVNEQAADDYLMATKSMTGLPGPSSMLHTHGNGSTKCVLKQYSNSSDGRKPSDDETDSTAYEIGLGNIRLDLPLDEDDYLMPTCQSQSAAPGGYMDLIGTPGCVDNPEYLMGSANPSAMHAMTPHQTSAPPPTQTIGIPVITSMTLEGEPSSDHEYYNDLQRELQPLQRNETTV